MRVVKLTKKRLNMDLGDLLTELGATYLRLAFPQHVYMSDKDYGTLRRNLTLKFKKELKIKSVTYPVEVHLLNLGPNLLLGDVIKPGCLVVDDGAISREIEANLNPC